MFRRAADGPRQRMADAFPENPVPWWADRVQEALRFEIFVHRRRGSWACGRSTRRQGPAIRVPIAGFTRTRRAGSSSIGRTRSGAPTSPTIPPRQGFLDLLAIMDWRGREVLAWRPSSAMDGDFRVAALAAAVGPPWQAGDIQRRSKPAPGLNGGRPVRRRGLRAGPEGRRHGNHHGIPPNKRRQAVQRLGSMRIHRLTSPHERMNL